MIRALALVALWLLTAAAVPFDPFREAGIDLRPGAHVDLGIPVTGEDGRRTTLGGLAGGRALLLVPVLHDCPNLCGVTLDGLADAIEQRPGMGGQTAIVAFGIDAREDAADARADLARLAGRHPRLAVPIHATIAPPGAIVAVMGALGYRFAFDPRIGQYAHSAAIAVLTPDGRLVRWLNGLAPDPDALAAALGDARAGRAGGVFAQLSLLCYHYDPETGRYGLAIDWLLRAACLLTVAALLGYVAFARRGERPC